MSLTGLMQAHNTYARDIKVLPSSAQSELKHNFDSNVSVIKIDKKLGLVKEYEVILDDGTEITYDSKANWTDIEVDPRQEVPSAYIPAKIAKFVKNSHRDSKIVGIEKDRKGYDVTLSNGIDIIFSPKGDFVKYD